MAEWTGLEPATPGVTGRYSNQLNYHSAKIRGMYQMAEWTGLEPATPGVTGRYSNQLELPLRISTALKYVPQRGVHITSEGQMSQHFF